MSLSFHRSHSIFSNYWISRIEWTRLICLHHQTFLLRRRIRHADCVARNFPQIPHRCSSLTVQTDHLACHAYSKDGLESFRKFEDRFAGPDIGFPSWSLHERGLDSLFPSCAPMWNVWTGTLSSRDAHFQVSWRVIRSKKVSRLLHVRCFLLSHLRNLIIRVKENYTRNVQSPWSGQISAKPARHGWDITSQCWDGGERWNFYKSMSMNHLWKRNSLRSRPFFFFSTGRARSYYSISKSSLPKPCAISL